MSGRPLVSIVTPSFNSADFIEETIASVLSQDYPRIEYIVIDGGSSDGTLAILEKYRSRLRYISEPDSGAPAAINKGFRLAEGSIISWLNADDTYLPGAVSSAVRHMEANPAAAAVYGNAFWTDENNCTIRPYPTEPFCRDRLARECFICQPACFMRSEAVSLLGGLDESLQLVFDYDLWIRMSVNARFAYQSEFWATSRMHLSNKTLRQRRKGYREAIEILARHFRYVPVQLVFAYCSHLLTGRDQFFERRRPSALAYLAALPAGWLFNPSKPLRYVREWASVLTSGLTRTVRKNSDF
jgi:glycosyltransferase involved in cell wall biosynthesis